jgi:hypothetical protein
MIKTPYLLILFLWFISIGLYSKSINNDYTSEDSIGDLEPTSLPHASIDNFSYIGAFKLPAKEYGISSTNFSAGKMTLSKNRNSIFIIGHVHKMAIAEFIIPKLTNSNNLHVLEEAQKPIQPFSTFLNRAESSNPQRISGVTGLININKSLFVNGVEYYDAEADNTHTSVIISNSDNIKNSKIKGFFSLEGAAHAAGWISEIPKFWQQQLGGTHITGFASSVPINSRLSIGPAAFAFSPKKIDSKSDRKIKIPTIPLMDFSLDHPLDKDLYNKNGGNFLWNELSQAVYGFIIPNTRTYAVFGSMGGLYSKIGYKINQKNGNLCSGPCAYDSTDYYNYYWFFDINDLIAVKNKKMKPYNVKPYEYGQFQVPFQFNHYKQTKKFRGINGATFDNKTNTIYFSISEAGQVNRYETPPVIAGYRINVK